MTFRSESPFMSQTSLKIGQAMTRLRDTLRETGPRPRRDPPARAFPQGARMLFGIGAQKAGTSWLYELLSQSPEMHFSPNKELHYFDVRAHGGGLTFDMRARHAADLAAMLAAHPHTRKDNNFERLRAITALLAIYTGPQRGPERHRAYLDYLLEGCAPGQTACDITPAYAVLDRRVYADMASIGEARFLFAMRDPVARMWSQVRMAVTARKTPEEEMETACRAHAEMLIETGRLPKIERADYRRTMTELEAAVPADRIMYVFYEDLFAQPTADAICDWIGIAPVKVDAEKRVNEGRSVPIPEDIAATFRKTFAPQYDTIANRFGEAVPAAWTRW